MSSLQELTRPTGKKIASLGATFMMAPSTGAAGAEIGLAFLPYYALGRGGVLGDVDGQVVADAFYFFEPGLVKDSWDNGKAVKDPREVATHYAQACAAWGRENLSDIAKLEEFCKLADRVAQAAEPPRSSGLFAGWRDMALPDDAPGRAAIQLMLVLRELRGGAHVDAVRQVGLDPREAVAVNSPHMYQLFGWIDEMPDAEPLKDRVAQAEDLTDETVAPAFAALDEGEREIFRSVVDAVCAKLGV
jgi:hypothetical protein